MNIIPRSTSNHLTSLNLVTSIWKMLNNKIDPHSPTPISYFYANKFIQSVNENESLGAINGTKSPPDFETFVHV